LNSAQALNKKLSGQIDDLTNGLEDTNNKCKHLDKDYKKLLPQMPFLMKMLHDQLTAETGCLESNREDLQQQQQLHKANAKIARPEKKKATLTCQLEDLKNNCEGAKDKLSGLEKMNKKLLFGTRRWYRKTQ